MVYVWMYSNHVLRVKNEMRMVTVSRLHHLHPECVLTVAKGRRAVIVYVLTVARCQQMVTVGQDRLNYVLTALLRFHQKVSEDVLLNHRRLTYVQKNMDRVG